MAKKKSKGNPNSANSDSKAEIARLRREIHSLRAEMRRDMWKLRLRVDRIAETTDDLRKNLAGAVLHGVKLMLSRKAGKTEE